MREQHLYSHDTSEDMHMKLTGEWGDASTHYETYFIKNGQKSSHFGLQNSIFHPIYTIMEPQSQYNLKRVNTKL